MSKQKCIDCKKSYKNLTNEGLCACCHKLKHKTWAKEFTNQDVPK